MLRAGVAPAAVDSVQNEVALENVAVAVVAAVEQREVPVPAVSL